MNKEAFKIEGRDIVIISIQPWYYPLGSNCKNIALELSKHNRVLYVNIPITRKTFYQKSKEPGVSEHCTIIKNKENTIRQVKMNLWQLYPVTIIESINKIPFTPLFRLLNKINNKRFCHDIALAVGELGFSNIILFNDNDIYNGFYLKELLQPECYVYYMRDFLQGYAFWKKHCSVLEPELISKSDLVVTNSVFYRDYCLNYNSKSVYMGQGCNLDNFDATKSHPKPRDMAMDKQPIIGYTGALDSNRLNHEIIRIIAETHPEWNIVLVGPEDEEFKKSTLHNISNIKFKGAKHMNELPAYVQHFDVCINPQKINTATQGNYPLKVDEYLAMGKPVVATHTKTMELFQKHTFLAKTPREYPGLIEKALAGKSQEEQIARIAFAHSHTWANSVEILYAALKQKY